MPASIRLSCLLVSLIAGLAPALSAATPIDTVKAYYLGNSFTGNTMPGLHQALGTTAGKTWTVEANIQPGVPIWVHMNNMRTENRNGVQFLERAPATDTLVMLIFADPGIGVKRKKMWGKVDFGEELDIGAPNACALLIERYLELSPEGRAFIYTPWPGIPGAHDVRDRIREEARQTLEAEGLPREEVLKKVKERKPTQEEMDPLQRSFDYAASYLAKPPAVQAHEEFSPPGHAHTRAYFYKVMEQLKDRFPGLWSEGRLGMVPMGDVFLAIDEAMRAGQVPGLENIGQYSADGGHLRAGLPRYTLAATHFAVLFKQHPGACDADIFNHRDHYASGNGFYVHQPDLGTLLTITPERKQAIDDIIWQVVSTHPYTQVSP